MAYRGDEPAPLLPSSIRDAIKGWLCKLLGFLVLLGCGAGGVSLLTWSAADPSLTHATSTATRNLLGPIGAIVSDLIMQMLGLAGVFGLLPPIFWALQLVTQRGISQKRDKLILAPAAVFLLAGAAASLPAAAAWPLQHGYGGLLGDFGLGVLGSVIAHINPTRSTAAAGMLFSAAGVLLLVGSLGLTRQDLKLICRTGSGMGGKHPGGWWRRFGEASLVVRAPANRARSGGTGETRLEPVFPPLPAALEGEPGAGSPAGLDEPPHAHAEEPAIAGGGRESSFDAITDRASRAIAARFAPHGRAASSTRVRTPGPTLRAEPRLEPLALRPQSRPRQGVEASARQAQSGCRRPPLSILKRPFGRRAIEAAPAARRRERVHLRELLDDDRWRSCDATLPLALGRDLAGTPLIADLARMPHLLIAGSAGTGRSVAINAMILSLIYRLSPDQCRLLLIDPMLEHCVWDGLPHLLCPVVGEAHKAVTALDWVVAEMDRRYQQMARLGLRNIDVFNNRVRQAQKRAPAHGGDGELGPLAHLVIIVGELGELIVCAGDAIEAAVQRLAQAARAAGIHLIMATRRPSSEILTPAIKASIPARVCFKVASGLDSRSILNEQGAEQLLGQGDMLFLHGSGRTLRAQGCYVSDEEVEGVVRFLRNEGEPHYVEGITGSGEGAAHLPPAQGWEELYDHAVSIVVHEQKASTSYLQRRLSLGYNRAADLMERMEQEGIVSAPGRGGRRHILRCI